VGPIPLAIGGVHNAVRSARSAARVIIVRGRVLVLTEEDGAMRTALAVAIGALVTAYTVGVVSGAIGKDDRIDAAALGVIGLGAAAVAALLYPGVFRRLRLFEMGGFKLEMLETVKERQDRQAEELEDMRLVLPILLPGNEQNHLRNLADGTTKAYRGGEALRTELRRLRSIGLIRMKPGRTVGALVSTTTFDLGDYIELTDLGARWIERLREIDEPQSPDVADET
jgi:hypothetical protein